MQEKHRNTPPDTHLHTQLFYNSWDFVWDDPGELLPDGTFAIFCIFWCKMNITQADATTIWMDCCHPSTNSKTKN